MSKFLLNVRDSWEKNKDKYKNYDDPNKRFPLCYRNNNYISQMTVLNDWYWNDIEKWLYYKKENQDCIIPTVIGCFLMFFGAHPAISIPMIIITILVVLYICHCNNKKMDDDPEIQRCRKESVEFRRKHMKMDM